MGALWLNAEHSKDPVWQTGKVLRPWALFRETTVLVVLIVVTISIRKLVDVFSLQ